MRIRSAFLAVFSAVVIGFGARPTWAYDTIHFLPSVPLSRPSRPVALAVGRGRFYVLDMKKAEVSVYSLKDGGFLKTTLGRGQGEGELDEPEGIATGPDGRVYVTDTGNDRIAILDADGKFLSSFGSEGSGPGELDYPQGVAVGTDGRVYVADTGNNRVQVFTADGILLFWFGGSGSLEGQFKDPEKIQVDPGDNVYVLDSGNDRIQKFDSKAKFVSAFPASGRDFAVDAYGFCYILDSKHGKVSELNPQGAVLGVFGSRGNGAGQFKKPQAVAVGPNGAVMVLDSGNKRVQEIELSDGLETVPVAPNLETKIFVKTSTLSWAISAGVLAGDGNDLYAYIPVQKHFVALSSGSVPAQLGSRRGAVKDSQGFAASSALGFYVSDTPDDRVEHFDSSGAWKFNFAGGHGFFGFLGRSKDGRVDAPRGVAINDKGIVYVADAGNHRVEAFDPSGTFLFAIGPKLTLQEGGEVYILDAPAALAWDKSGFLYILDEGAARIFKCEPSGALTATWGARGDKPGELQSPVSLAFDGREYLYVLDSQLKRVSVYDAGGDWVTDLFSPGTAPGQLVTPVSLAIAGGALAVSDPGRGRVLSFSLRPALAPPVEISTSVKDGMAELSWSGSEDAWFLGYRIYRADDAEGPYQEAGESGQPMFEDVGVNSGQNYFYRVAAEAATHDLGPRSAPVEVSISGPANLPPVEISSVTLGDIFPANYKWYLKNPIGRAVVVNNLNVPFRDLKLTFRLKDFMDFGYDTEIKTLGPHETMTIPLVATLNNAILEVTEDTPIQAELSLTYFDAGRQRSVSLSEPLRVYSRNAIVWNDPRRIANFVTPQDPPVVDFARQALLSAPQDLRTEALNSNAVAALDIWDALSAAGVRFFAKPDDPYEAISLDRNFPIDYTQFPRETLKRKSGQCDDLATLLASLLESAEVRSAILDYPGHMELMFDTGADSIERAGLPASWLIKVDGHYWVPIEPTFLGQDFAQAVQKAAYDYRTLSAQGVDLRQAWTRFEPATLPSSEDQYPAVDAKAAAKDFSRTMDEMFSQEYDFLKADLEAGAKANPGDATDTLELGILEHEAGKDAAAKKDFESVLARDPSNAAALNDMGNLFFFSKDYAQAADFYAKAAAAQGQDPDYWMNLLKAKLHLKDVAAAKAAGEKAVALDPDLTPAVASLTGYGN